MVNMKTGLLSIAIIGIVMLLSGSGLQPALSAPVIEKSALGQADIIKEDSGYTHYFGGGNFVGVRFGNDAWFGVVYGTENHSNYITIGSVIARYLGAAVVKDTNGNIIYNQIPIKVYSVYGIQLRWLLEFNDQNNNGIFDHERKDLDPTKTNNIYNDTVYKWSHLKTAWTRTPVDRTVTNTSITYKFNLSAENLPINSVFGNAGTLDKIQFNFKLKAYLEEVNGKTYPRYEVIVDRDTTTGDWRIVSSTRIEDGNYTGKVMKYSVKVDHIIEGWDFAHINTNPGLALETVGIIGTYLSEGFMKWARAQYCQCYNNSDSKINMNTETDTSKVTYNEDNLALGRSMRLKSPRISVEDKWTKVGYLTWVTDVNVTRSGNTTQENMYFQVQGAVRLINDNPGARDGLFIGWIYLGAFSYPGGEKIVHDPEVGGEAYTMNISTEIGKPRFPLGILLFIVGVIVLVVVIGTIAWTLKRRRQKQGDYYRDSYDQKNR